MHTTEPLVPEPRTFEVEVAVVKLKRYETSGIDQILTELIQAVGNTLCSEIHEIINSIENKEELPQQWRKSILLSIYKMAIKLTIVIVEGYHCYQLHTNFYQ
jgi:CRISPR/Cas system-associated protein Csm6